MLSRVSEKVFFDLFNSISNGKRRIPLASALNSLNLFFNSPQNPYHKLMCSDSSNIHMTGEEFLDQFYSRNVDKRHGLRSHALMAGGARHLRGNARGHRNAALAFPQVSFEQFFGIAKDMESAFLERLLPGLSQGKQGRLTSE